MLGAIFLPFFPFKVTKEKGMFRFAYKRTRNVFEFGKYICLQLINIAFSIEIFNWIALIWRKSKQNHELKWQRIVEFEWQWFWCMYLHVTMLFKRFSFQFSYFIFNSFQCTFVLFSRFFYSFQPFNELLNLSCAQYT